MINIGSLEVASNRATFTEPHTVLDSITGLVVDITTAEIKTCIRDIDTGAEMLTASVGDGVTITDGPNGEFEWTHSSADMRQLCKGTYDVGIVITIGGVDLQYFAGTIPIIDGVVP